MEVKNIFKSLPDTKLLALVKYINIKYAADMEGGKEILSQPHVMKEVALRHGLPFSDDLDQLLQYSEMTPKELARISAERGDIRVVKATLDASSDDQISENEILVFGAKGGQVEIVELILTLGRSIGNDDYGRAMIQAAQGGHLEIVELILSLGRSIGQEEYTEAMFNAAYNGHVEIVELMLLLGAGRNKGRDRSREISPDKYDKLKSNSDDYTEGYKFAISRKRPDAGMSRLLIYLSPI